MKMFPYDSVGDVTIVYLKNPFFDMQLSAL